MEYAKEVDITNDNDEYAISNNGNNKPLAEGNNVDETISTPAPPAALRASYSQQYPLRV